MPVKIALFLVLASVLTLSAQDTLPSTPPITQERLITLFGECNIRVAAQGDYIQILQRTINELRAELTAIKGNREP